MNESIKVLEKKLEDALIAYEQNNEYDLALHSYQEVEEGVLSLLGNFGVNNDEAHALLAQCYLRQAGMLRQLGRLEEASIVNQKELESAKLSGNEITYAQSLFSTGINFLSNRKIDDGLAFMNEAKLNFEKGDSPDHKQGIGWYWVILADLGNKKILNISNEQIIQYADKAINILTEIQNTPGINRAHQAKNTALGI